MAEQQDPRVEPGTDVDPASDGGMAAADPLPPPEAPAEEAARGDWELSGVADGETDPLAECLVLLARALDRPISPTAATAGLPLVDGRLTPSLCVRAAARAGLTARILKRRLEELVPALVPCILLLRGRRACVLVGRTADGRMRVALPEAAGGIADLDADELAEDYIGHAVVARPAPAGERGDEEARRRPAGHWFWSVLLRQWPLYAEVAVAAVMINLFVLASPLFTMNVYDRVVPNRAIETLWVLAIGAVTVFGFDFLLRTLRGYFVDSAGRIADIKLASRIFEHVLGIRMEARPASAGAFANHLREFESLRDFFASATITTLIDLPFVFLFIGVIALIGGPIALVPAIAVPLVLGVGLLVQIPLDRVVRATFRQAAARHGLLVEAINGLETIKAVGAEGRTQRAFEQYVAETALSANRARLLSAITVNTTALASNLVTVGIVVYGVHLIAEGQLTVGALVACTIIAGRTMAPLAQTAGVLTRFHQAKMAYTTLDKVMKLPVERPPGMRFLHRPTLDGAIELRGVRFRYPRQKEWALDGVDLVIRPGERVGIVGRIGSGKTTIGKLILGLYEPQEGAVLVDGVDVRQIDPADLRRNIGAVLQDAVLFQGTLRENIVLGAGTIDDATVLRAARLAGVEDFARHHPLGYDMPIGERGEALSGGQRQAVALARALLLDPPILVLDEPTSAMDNGAENALMRRLAPVLKGRTLLLVTHRGSLLALVERIVVVDAGRVVADGPRDRVLEALRQGRIRGVRQ
jgi:ATP-binding cassette subfamily C protein LapB